MNQIKGKNTLLLVIAMLICQPFMTTLVAQDDDDEWKLLGITTVKEALERDEVKITALKGQFTHLKIKVRNAPLEMKKFVIHYGNGEKHQVFIRKNFAKGSESRAIDLRGDKRFIKKVVFWYAKKKWSGKKPVVALIGK